MKKKHAIALVGIVLGAFWKCRKKKVREDKTTPETEMQPTTVVPVSSHPKISDETTDHQEEPSAPSILLNNSAAAWKTRAGGALRGEQEASDLEACQNATVYHQASPSEHGEGQQGGFNPQAFKTPPSSPGQDRETDAAKSFVMQHIVQPDSPPAVISR